MGQKSSKKTDLYVTDDVTHCKLPDSDVNKYVGRAREYTAVDVIVEKPTQDESPVKKDDGSPRKKTPENPDSIIQLLHRAHRKSYNLAFIIPRVKGSRPTHLNRNSLVEEDPEDGDAAKKEDDLTHTVFLWRPKVKARLKKEMSLKKMEAKKTFLNMMMDIQHKWIFSVKEFESDVAKIESGEYVAKLQEMISNEAAKGGRLLSVMRVDDNVTKENGVSNGGGSEPGSPNQTTKKNGKLTLRMVFLHRNSEKAKQKFLYNVKCVNMNCTEEKIKVKKKQKTKLPRDTNITWSENWLDLFDEDSRITEVINVGEMNRSGEDFDAAKNKKKLKKREFQVMTLCFHEKPVAKDTNDNDDVTGDDEDDDEDTYEPPMRYESLVREVWAPIDDSVQQNLESEAERFGKNGWELCTVLVTSHIRMKQDGSEFRKCAIFFQRPKGEFVPDNERTQSTDNLLQAGNVEIEETNAPETEMLDPENIPPTSPKEKVERFGVALMPQVDLNQAKLRAAKPSPQKTKANDAVISGLAAVQLKKVNREEVKKPDVAKDVEEKQAIMPQVKLRKTEPKQEKKLEVAEKEVPWANSLERKREAVMKSEDKAKTPEAARKKEEGSDEIARKIDEIKEKRAQRQNRISIHKEEEKRKSLEAEKRKSLEEEKRKSQIAAASVVATDVAEKAQPEVPGLQVEDSPPTKQPEDLAPPAVEELPPPAVDDMPSEAVKELPSPVVEAVKNESLPDVPEVPKEADDVPIVKETCEPEIHEADLPTPAPEVEPEITEETLNADVVELENALAEFEQQLDESTASAEGEEAEEADAPTVDVVAPEVVEEKSDKDETSDQDNVDVELPLPLSLEPPKSALSSLHLPSPPPPDQEDAPSPLEENQQPLTESPPEAQTGIAPIPPTPDQQESPNEKTPPTNIEDVAPPPEVDVSEEKPTSLEDKPQNSDLPSAEVNLPNGDLPTPLKQEPPVEESRNSAFPPPEVIPPTDDLPSRSEVELPKENLPPTDEDYLPCELPPPVPEEVKSEATLNDISTPSDDIPTDLPSDVQPHETQETPPPEDSILPPAADLPPPEPVEVESVSIPDCSSSETPETSTETILPPPPPSQEEETKSSPEDKQSDDSKSDLIDLPPPAEIPPAKEPSEDDSLPEKPLENLPIPFSSPEKTAKDVAEKPLELPPPPTPSNDNDKKE